MLTTPCFVTVLPTASKRLSATGSIMYFINSFTDTTGLRSPQSTGACEDAVVAAGGGGAFDEEHAVIVAQRMSQAYTESRRALQTMSTSTPVTRVATSSNHDS